jgi:hypothetical protein
MAALAFGMPCGTVAAGGASVRAGGRSSKNSAKTWRSYSGSYPSCPLDPGGAEWGEISASGLPVRAAALYKLCRCCIVVHTGMMAIG